MLRALLITPEFSMKWTLTASCYVATKINLIRQPSPTEKNSESNSRQKTHLALTFLWHAKRWEKKNENHANSNRRKRRISWLCSVLTLTDDLAEGEWISLVIIDARANGIVIDYTTLGINAANSIARITTALLHAGQMRCALGINGTLRSTVRWYADVILQTGASKTFPTNLTLSVRPTRSGNTWIFRYRCLD